MYCFLHKDIRASGPCSLCNRPYCPACLNTMGFCGLCAQHNEEARRRAFSAPGDEAPPPRRRSPALLVLGLALVVAAGLGWGFLRTKQPARDVSRPSQQAASGQGSELTAQEKAFMASLKRERRVAMPDAPRHPARQQGAAPVEAVAEVRRTTLGHAAPAPPAPPQQPVEAITIQALTPAEGSIVGGRAPIRVWTSGQPARVVCEVDGSVIGVQAGPRPVFLWNTRASGNGPHQVTVTASGRGGTSSASLTLNVMNR